jgi:DNA-binding NtrC family response regulator
MKGDVKLDSRLMLVENEAPLRRSLENFLQTGGYNFQSCSNAREALALAQAIHPDVVIVEHRLPDACGLALVDKLGKICPHLVAAVISEYDFKLIADKFERFQIDYFLKKPFDPVELETVLCSSCSKAHSVLSDSKLTDPVHLKVCPPPS